MNSFEALRDPKLCAEVLEKIDIALEGRSPALHGGLRHPHRGHLPQRRALPAARFSVTHLTGPGCPVCVTHDAEVAAFLEAAARPGVILATFGDLMRVPGPDGGSLKEAKAAGARVEVVYSPFDALRIAADNPKDTVVFPGIGFETTAPAVAATIRAAREQGLANFLVMPFHKLVPPALEALLSDPSMTIEGFMLPGHVSAIIGLEPYGFVAERHGPAGGGHGVRAPGHAPGHPAHGRDEARRAKPRVINNYKRVVADEGNPKARAVLEEVYRP